MQAPQETQSCSSTLQTDPDEVTVQQSLQHSGRADTTHLLDLGRRDRLSIGNDGQGLQRRHRHPVSTADREEPTQISMQVGTRHQSDTTSDVFRHFDPLKLLGPEEDSTPTPVGN